LRSRDIEAVDEQVRKEAVQNGSKAACHLNLDEPD
jgi:hypothetical protein